VAELARHEGLPARRFTPDAVTLLQGRDWPGNVRELRNAIERLVILTGGDSVSAADVRRVLGEAPDESALGDLAAVDTFERFKAEAEKTFLLGKLAENNWNVSETARKLDMPRSNLYKKIEKYGLSRERES
jgi:two-component system nitrogen regulation response regulator NtrX